MTIFKKRHYSSILQTEMSRLTNLFGLVVVGIAISAAFAVAVVVVLLDIAVFY